MDDDGPRLVYNPEDGSVELRTPGPGITVDGIDGEIRFERMTASGNSAVPLWLEPEEAVVLGKMLGYILDRVKITEGSRTILEALQPRVDEIGQQAAVAADSE